MSTLLHLLNTVPTPLLIGFVVSNVIPYLSALATKAPSWATGAITLALSTLTGFLSEWAAQGSAFDWKAALGASLVSWAVAALHHSKILAGTQVEAQLYAVGAPRPAQAG